MLKLEEISLKNVKKSLKPSGICSFDVTISTIGITIRECSLMFSKNKREKWVSMPYKTYQENGETKYYNLILWDRDKKEAFDRAVIHLVSQLIDQDESLDGSKKDKNKISLNESKNNLKEIDDIFRF